MPRLAAVSTLLLVVAGCTEAPITSPDPVDPSFSLARGDLLAEVHRLSEGPPFAVYQDRYQDSGTFTACTPEIEVAFTTDYRSETQDWRVYNPSSPFDVLWTIFQVKVSGGFSYTNVATGQTVTNHDAVHSMDVVGYDEVTFMPIVHNVWRSGAYTNYVAPGDGRVRWYIGLYTVVIDYMANPPTLTGELRAGTEGFGSLCAVLQPE